MKKALMAIILVSFSVLLAGCVAKSDYDALVKEKDELKKQVTTLQTNLDSLKANNENLKPIITRLSKEIKASAVLNSMMASGMNIYSGTGTTSGSSWNALGGTFIADFGQAINDIGDEKLSQRWKDMIQTAASGDVKGATSKMGATFLLLSQMTNDDMVTLQSKLR